MEAIINIAIFFACGIISGMFTSFFLFSSGGPDGGRDNFKPGRILSFYGLWVLDRFDAYESKIEAAIAAKERDIMDMDCDIDLKYQIVEKMRTRLKTKKVNIFKALGVCGYCTATWFSFGGGIVACLVFGMPIWLILFVPAVGTVTYALARPLLP